MLTEYSYMYMHEPHTDVEDEMGFLDDVDLDSWLEMEYEDRYGWSDSDIQDSIEVYPWDDWDDEDDEEDF